MEPKQKVLRCGQNEVCDATVRHENKETVEVSTVNLSAGQACTFWYFTLEAVRPFDFVNLDFNT